MIKKIKKCFKCGETKSLIEFYKHSRMLDGHLNKCKDCTKKDTQKNYRANIQYYKTYNQNRAKLPHRVKNRKEYAKSEKGIEVHKNNIKTYIRKNPHKRQAHNQVNNAIRSGKLKKQVCFICGERQTQAHHYDYSKPLSVIWFCHEHHLWMHRSEVPF